VLLATHTLMFAVVAPRQVWRVWYVQYALCRFLVRAAEDPDEVPVTPVGRCGSSPWEGTARRYWDDGSIDSGAARRRAAEFVGEQEMWWQARNFVLKRAEAGQ